MEEKVQISTEEKIILMADTIVYGQKPYWSSGDYRQQCLSILMTKQQKECTENRVYPLIVFICGGSFQRVQRNVWMPELVEYAKKGYVVASVDYSVLPYTVFPEALEDIKAAIRYLRANASQFSIDPANVGIMGESAGACLALLAAVTSGMQEYDKGENCEYSSSVQTAVAFYPASSPAFLEEPKLAVDVSGYPDIRNLVTEQCPPVYLLHGLSDKVIPYTQSVRLYDRLQEMKVKCDLTLIEDADHADDKFFQGQIKNRVCRFLDQYLK